MRQDLLVLVSGSFRNLASAIVSQLASVGNVSVTRMVDAMLLQLLLLSLRLGLMSLPLVLHEMSRHM